MIETSTLWGSCQYTPHSSPFCCWKASTKWNKWRWAIKVHFSLNCLAIANMHSWLQTLGCQHVLNHICLVIFYTECRISANVFKNVGMLVNVSNHWKLLPSKHRWWDGSQGKRKFWSGRLKYNVLYKNRWTLVLVLTIAAAVSSD